jgi:DNA-directed RNA polymerase subunit E'/Rpb7
MVNKKITVRPKMFELAMEIVNRTKLLPKIETRVQPARGNVVGCRLVMSKNEGEVGGSGGIVVKAVKR